MIVYKPLTPKNVKIRRAELGLLAKTFAEAIDVSGTYLSRFENGKERLSYQTALKISKALGYSGIALGTEEAGSNNLYFIEEV